MQSNEERDPVIVRFVCLAVAIVSLLVSAFVFSNMLAGEFVVSTQYIFSAVAFLVFVIISIRFSIAAVSPSKKNQASNDREG